MADNRLISFSVLLLFELILHSFSIIDLEDMNNLIVFKANSIYSENLLKLAAIAISKCSCIFCWKHLRFRLPHTPSSDLYFDQSVRSSWPIGNVMLTLCQEAVNMLSLTILETGARLSAFEVHYNVKVYRVY